jgi:cell division protein FtsL
MKRIIVVSGIVFVSLLFFADVWQSYQCVELSRRITELEHSQFNKIEENKRAIAGLTMLRSPARIESIARDSLGLKRLNREDVLVIKLPGGETQ